MTFPLSPGRPEFEDLPLHLIPDHEDRGLARLLTQLQQKPRLATLLRIFIRPLQELETTLWDLHTKRTLDSAQGEQLDLLGRILDEPRGPLNDIDYRTVLRIKILVLKSSGRAPELMHICAVLVGSLFGFREYFPAAIAVDLFTAPAFDVHLLAKFLRRAKSAGVRIDVWSGADPLRFASSLSGGGHGLFASSLSGGGSGGFAGVH